MPDKHPRLSGVFAKVHEYAVSWTAVGILIILARLHLRNQEIRDTNGATNPKFERR
jgi:hypothetical protein